MSLSTSELEAFFQGCGPDENGFVYESDIDMLLAKFQSQSSSTDIGGPPEVGCKGTCSPERLQTRSFDRQSFIQTVSSWRIPSFRAPSTALDGDSKAYEANLPLGRRLRAHWAVEGYQSTFVTAVMCLQIGMAVWLLVKQLLDAPKLHLLGWGLVVAKTSAGVLYPTLALLILSSSRALGTWLRGWRACARFINWDLSQSFHIQMAIVAIVFISLHVIGHLGGTFVYLSRSPPGAASATLHNFVIERPTYSNIMSSLPAITGLFALSIIVIIFCCSLPKIRRSNFELFQACHLLIYPLIGLLMAHGTRGWLQSPMLGYWLAGPTLLLLFERCIRLGKYVDPIQVESVPQQAGVVMLILRRKKVWAIRPGQYILLCVPAISRYQWHPFTVSAFSGTNLCVHIRDSGKWTKAIGAGDFATAFVDGPFGAPAQKFHDFDRAVVIGTGIGITPYIGILSSKVLNHPHTRTVASSGQVVDFHWIAREASMFSWFASLLNHLSTVEPGVNVSTYLTAKAKDITDHVFTVLTDRGISCIRAMNNAGDDDNTISPLTGLHNATNFGRPDFGKILRQNEEDLPKEFTGNIGIFFCGPKYVGMELADRCKVMTARATRKISWTFVGEVF